MILNNNRVHTTEINDIYLKDIATQLSHSITTTNNFIRPAITIHTRKNILWIAIAGIIIGVAWYFFITKKHSILPQKNLFDESTQQFNLIESNIFNEQNNTFEIDPDQIKSIIDSTSISISAIVGPQLFGEQDISTDLSKSVSYINTTNKNSLIIINQTAPPLNHTIQPLPQHGTYFTNPVLFNSLPNNEQVSINNIYTFDLRHTHFYQHCYS